MKWDIVMVIPLKYRSHIMSELHNSHPGMARMKGLSRIHVWFPNIAKRIEEEVTNCTECINVSKTPAKAYIHTWSRPTKAFDRVHIDYFGPFLGRN